MLLSHTPDIFYIAFEMQSIDVNVSISDITTPRKQSAGTACLPSCAPFLQGILRTVGER